MSCFVKQIKSCEIFGDTINSRIFSFDISVKKVNALIQKNDSLNITHKILEINDNKHILNIQDLNLIIGNYKITYIFEILINGKQIKKTFCIEELVIKKAGCNCNEVINELNFIINLEEINIPVNIDLSITNINGQGGDLSWGNINGNIENQADLIQKFGDYYTKPQSDARFKSISYTPNWSEVSGKPTTFTPSAHTHTISEIDNLQNTLANKIDKVIGKQLSTEDYTTAEKNKLAGIQEGAEANVNADWNATSGDTQILNKPTVFPPSTHIHNIADVNNLQTALNGKEPIISTGTTSQYFRGDKTWQIIDKSTVGLNNVDNTSDANKPISLATQNALNLKADKGLNIKITTPSNWVTGTTSEVEVLRIEIPANSLSASDVLRIPFLMVNKIGTNATMSIRGKLSTLPTMPSGATDQIFQFLGVQATNQYVGLDRQFIIEGGQIKGFPFGINSAANSINSNGQFSFKSFDRTVTNYLYVSIILTNSADQARLEGLQLTNS